MGWNLRTAEPPGECGGGGGLGGGGEKGECVEGKGRRESVWTLLK